MKIKTLILGSGIGGLAAGAELIAKGDPDFFIIEKSPSLPMNLHNGLHYLHSIPHTPFPMEYKKVTLTEEIWNVRKDEFSKCATLPQMFEYSKKIMENLRHPSSIMDPGKMEEVWIPESNNMNDLLNGYHQYIGNDKFIFGASVVSIDLANHEVSLSTGDLVEFENCISTVPINAFYKLCNVESPYEFKHKTIHITNYETTNIVPNWLIVLYISDPKFPPYRMTVMNNILSMESIVEMTPDDKVIVKYHTRDLFDYELSSEKSYAWETGRIFGVSKEERERMVKFFEDHRVYLLGRFARWDGKLRMDTTVEQAKEIINNIENG